MPIYVCLCISIHIYPLYLQFFPSTSYMKLLICIYIFQNENRFTENVPHLGKEDEAAISPSPVVWRREEQENHQASSLHPEEGALPINLRLRPPPCLPDRGPHLGRRRSMWNESGLYTTETGRERESHTGTGNAE